MRHAGEEPLGRVVQHREVLGPQVLAPAEPVLRAGLAVVVERLRQQLATAHVEHEGDAGLGQSGPYAVVVEVGGRPVARSLRGHPHGSDPAREGLVERRLGPRRVGEGQPADRLEPRVGCTERGHGPVQRAGAAIAHVEVRVEGELVHGKGGEHELRVDAEGVEHPAAHVGVEGARGQPPLRPGDHVGPDLLVPVARPHTGQPVHQLLRAGTSAIEAEAAELLAHVGLGKAGEPVAGLHHMAVGVEDRGRHRFPLRSGLRCRSR